MWPPLYPGHLEKSQSMLSNTSSPLKCGHPSNKDTFTGPKGGRFRGVPLYDGNVRADGGNVSTELGWGT